MICGEWFGRCWSYWSTVLLAVVVGYGSYGCAEEATDPCSGDRTRYTAATPIGALYDSCFTRNAEFLGGGIAKGVLYVETRQPMNSEGSNRARVMLSSFDFFRPEASGGDWLTLKIDGLLDAEIDPGILGQRGWKLRFEEATVDLCAGCRDMCGQVPILIMQSEVENLEFFRDRADSVDVWLEFRRFVE